MNTAAHGTARGVAAALVVGLLSGLLSGPAAANDWPSWRGRAQTGASDVTGLVSSWSPEGENLIWYDRLGRALDARRLRRPGPAPTGAPATASTSRRWWPAGTPRPARGSGSTTSTC